MAAPVVGISSYTPCGGDGTSFNVPREYVDSLQSVGLTPVILPPGGPGLVLERLDGLVLAGGGDLDPATYGGRVHETNYMMDAARDAFELRLLDGALAVELPVLAICRGMQILNIAFGGNLIAHVPECYGDLVTHRLPPREPVMHEVSVLAGSRLAEAVGAANIGVMSWHHQAVDSVGEGLRVLAHAADGVIEALEVENGGWVVGVQWHPELDAAKNPPQAALFRRFAEAVRGWSRRNP